MDPFDITRLNNFENLPREEDVDPDLPVYTEPEVLRLLEDFGLAEDPGIQEIRRRVQFVTLENLFTLIHYRPTHWVRHLGARTAARLQEATFHLSRLSYVEDLVQFLHDAMANQEGQEGGGGGGGGVGRWYFDVDRQHVLFYDQEVGNTTPQGKWSEDLCRAIRHDIEQLATSRGNSSVYTSVGDSTLTAFDRSVPAGGPNDFVPTDILVPTVEEDTSDGAKGSGPTPPTADETKESSDSADDRRIHSNTPLLLSPNIAPVPQTINGPQKMGSLTQGGRTTPAPPTTLPRVESTPSPEPNTLDNIDEQSGGTDTNVVEPQVDVNRNKYFRKFCILTAALVLNFVLAGLALRFGFDFKAGDFVPSEKTPVFPTAAPTVGTPVPTLGPTAKVKWGQVGGDMRSPSGFNIQDAYGWSVAIDAFGRRVAIGAPGDGGVGRVYTYELKEEWVLLGSEEGLQGDQLGCEFGNSTDLSDDGMHLAVGARNHSDGRGQASVYTLSNGSWKLRGQPLYGQFRNDNFGNMVSISANGLRMAVGAARLDLNGNENVGSVQVYEYNEDTREWIQIGQTLFGEQAHEKFGFSLKLAGSGDVLVVGAPFRHRREELNEAGQFEWGGAVMAYEYDGNDWIQLGQTIKHNNPVERFGWSVDASVRGYVIAVGAPVNDGNGEASGQVRVYEYKSDETEWMLRGNPIQGQDLGSWFGNTVSLSSDGLKVVSALWCDKEDEAQCDFGLRMYRYIPQTRKWVQFGDDLPGKTRYDPYSSSAAMAKDDTVLMTSVDLESGETVVQTYKPVY